MPDIVAAISLNAGVRPVSHFALVPAVAQWRQIPILPCTADVIISGERKDLGNLVANYHGLTVPRTFTAAEIDEAKSVEKIITKPRDLGGSYDITTKPGSAISQDDFRDGRIIQEFISGADVTIPLYYDSKNSDLCVGDATIYTPLIDAPQNWFYNREAKEAYVGGGAPLEIERRQIPTTKSLDRLLIRFAKAIGIDSFGRMDFRLASTEPDRVDVLSPENLFFVEINPMPTICAGLAFVEGMRSKLSRTANQTMKVNGLSLDDDYDVIAYVLANALMSQLHPAEMNNRDQIGS